jgi:tRNA modification GTPase
VFSTEDTIVAIATPPGRGGIGIVRLSGPDAERVAAALLEPQERLAPRHATFTTIVEREGSRVVRRIDRALATRFPAPRSYTGEDVVEISAHGSPVLLHDIVGLAMRAGARLAAPGEFTFRAYLHGRLDLVQAEAVADLIDAVTPLQARVAFDQLEGTLTRRIGEIWRELFDLVARLEASLDFPEEGYHFVAPDSTAAAIRAIGTRVAELVATSARGRLIREGAQVVILGRTNSGKSSIFNSLLGAERAIVTAVPGTTRDLLTERVDLEGLPVTLVDTAGIRLSPDAIEQEGIARARQAAAVSSLVLLVLDRSELLAEADRTLLAETAGSRRVVVVNKTDLPAAWRATDLAAESPVANVSALTRAGMDSLRRELVAALLDGDDSRDPARVSNLRHTELLERSRVALDRAAAAAADAVPEEFVLADLQEARAALEEVTGRRTPDDVLAHVFERFCLGK